MDLLNLLKGLNPNIVAYAFIGFMGVAFLMAVTAIARSRHPRYQQFAPNLLTTMGILGTFVGISIGLAEFNTQQIDLSIPKLLDGLKTAFITSIFGMALSIITRAYSTWSNRDDETADGDVGAEELHQVLVGIRGEIQQGNALADKTRQAIAGDGDASVVTQLQKVRTEIKDNAEEVQRTLSADMSGQSIGVAIESISTNLNQIGEKVADEFRSFAEKVSEIGSKQLIQALEEVIRDFNKNLMEQFGENFKHLNLSVQKLVVWQDQYRDQLTQMDQQFQETVKGLSASRDSVAEIAEKAAIIPESMTAFLAVMKSAGQQLRNLESHLEAFADMREKATGAMPEIRQRLDEIMDSIRDSVKKASQHYEIMLTDSEEATQRFKATAAEVQDRFTRETADAISQTNTIMSDTVRTLNSGAEAIQNAATNLPEKLEAASNQINTQLEGAIQTAFDEQNRRIQQMQGGLREAVSTAAEDQSQLITQLTRELDRVMQDEVTRVIQLMANNLGAITGKFVEDYTQLTSHMQQVIQQNRRDPQ